MYSIGEFSLITRLTVKTLRYYHNEGVLLPDYIDEDTGYRYYRESSIERAAIISKFRELGFGIAEIKSIVPECSQDSDAVEYLKAKQKIIRQEISSSIKTESAIKMILNQIERNRMNNVDAATTEISEKMIEDIIYAGFRMKGKYEEIGTAFKKVARIAGRRISGSPVSLYYNSEYSENDADMEGGFTVNCNIINKEINCRVLSGGKALTLIHRGKYDLIGKSYEKLFRYIKKNNLSIRLPMRVLYLKGPGMIFRGNPENYLSEIQIFLN